MHIDIQARGFELTDGLREHTMRRLSFATDWARDEVRRVTVRLSDINGPRGGEDKRCLIQIPLAGKTDIVIDELDSDLYVAIDKAIGRIERVLAKQIERAREHHHTTLKKTPAADPQESEQAEYVEH
jgi:putative sigma-54 modulation protein